MADELGPDDQRAAEGSAPPPADVPAPPAAQPAAQAPAPGPADPAVTRPPLDPLPPAPAAPNPVMTAWTALDQTSQMILGASLVLVVTLLMGSLVSAWAATGNFVLILLTAAIAAAATAWYTSTTNAGPKPSTLPLSTIEFAAGAVATVLAGLRVVEMLADFGHLSDYGGLIGMILTIVLAVAAAAMLAGAFRRDPRYRTPGQYGDTGTRLAISGLTLVILGWALSFIFSYWNMNAAATVLGLLTIATVAIIVAPRWATVVPEVPLAWVGAGLAAVSLLLAADEWGQFMDLGATRVELGILDFTAFLIYVIGIFVIIVGGVLAGRSWLATRPKRAPKPAPEPDAAAEATPAEATPAEAAPTGWGAAEPPAEPGSAGDPPTEA